MSCHASSSPRLLVHGHSASGCQYITILIYLPLTLPLHSPLLRSGTLDLISAEAHISPAIPYESSSQVIKGLLLTFPLSLPPAPGI